MVVTHYELFTGLLKPKACFNAQNNTCKRDAKQRHKMATVGSV